MGGNQLQPGVEDGGTPTEVVAAIEIRNPENQPQKEEKQKNKNKQTKKRRALSTRERGQLQYQQPGLSDLLVPFL